MELNRSGPPGKTVTGKYSIIRKLLKVLERDYPVISRTLIKKSVNFVNEVLYDKNSGVRDTNH